MGSFTTAAAILLMVLFAAGVLGCALTIPMCALKFFAILFERDQVQTPAYAHGLPYRSLQPDLAEETTEAPVERPRARGAAAGQ